VTVPPSSPSRRVRLNVLLVVVGCLFATLIARLWFLQVANAPGAQAASQGTGLRIIYTPAPRGEILSSDGQVLAGNVPAQEITLDRQQAKNHPAVEPRLAALLGVTMQELNASLGNKQVAPYAPVPVKNGATNQQILYIKEHPSLFPGVQVELTTARVYPMGPVAANIVGYTGQINGAQYKLLKSKGYGPSDQIGEAGIEATYESVLRGTPGQERVEVNAHGDVLGQGSYTPPVPGDNVVLSISAKDQLAAYNTLNQGMAQVRTQGAGFNAPYAGAVIQNPNNGKLDALVSVPDYDDNAFVGGISQSGYQSLLNNPTKPLVDEATSGEFAPGSTFKLVTATAGLQNGVITPTSVYDDTGAITIGNQTFHDDSGSGSGATTLPTAISQSIDTYFYNVGEQLYGKDPTGGLLANVASTYGFGSSTGIDLSGEAPGLVADAQITKKQHQQYPQAYPDAGFYIGNEMQEAIGQDEVSVTPLQLANAYSTFANGGTRYVPSVVQGLTSPDGKPIAAFASKVADQVTLPPDQRAAMLAGFEGVTTNGTAAGDFAGFPIQTAGKTGTADVNGQQPTSVFTAFAPATAPQYEVACIIDQAGYGADAAAPVVRSIYNQLYNASPTSGIGINSNGAFG
jgi:penicillin-binding protein 2